MRGLDILLDFGKPLSALELEMLKYMLLAAGLGRSRQVGGDGKSWSTGYWELG